MGIVSFGEGCGNPGYPGVYTRVASPTVRSFLATPNPIERPRNTDRPDLAGDARVGKALSCRPGGWAGSPTFRYFWLRMPFRNGQLLEQEVQLISGATAPEYLLTDADLGMVMLCAVPGTNAGGSDDAFSTGLGPVGPRGTGPVIDPPIKKDVLAPTVAITRRWCGRHRCQLTVLVKDDRPLGSAPIRATVRRLSGCRVRPGCKRTPLRIRTVTPGIHRIKTRRLRAGRHEFRVVARDAAGNRSTPSRVVLKVRRR
jgi:hypothetical protein